MTTTQEVCIFTDVVDPFTGGKIVINSWGGRTAYSPLTECCGASATGTEWGTACRVCYEEVDASFGGLYFWADLNEGTKALLQPWLDKANLPV